MRLLLESDLTLDKAITIATQIEAAAVQAKSMARECPLRGQAVHSAASSA